MKYDIYNGILDMRKDVWSLNKDTPGTNGVFLKMRKKSVGHNYITNWGVMIQLEDFTV